MIIGILGSLGDLDLPTTATKGSNCGCGKGVTSCHILYSEAMRRDEGYPNGRKVITNFHTWFPGGRDRGLSWAEYRTSQEIFDVWLEVEEGHPDYGAIIGLTELSALINSANRDKRVIAHVERCLNQRRKNAWDIVWDSQVLGSADKRWRENTEYIYRPVKYHCAWDSRYKDFLPTEPCPIDNCRERHLIIVYIEQSPFPLSILDLKKPQMILKAWEIGQLFDTNEKMRDVIRYNPAWAAGQ